MPRVTYGHGSEKEEVALLPSRRVLGQVGRGWDEPEGLGSEEKQEGKKDGDSQSGLESAVLKSRTLGCHYLLEK